MARQDIDAELATADAQELLGCGDHTGHLAPFDHFHGRGEPATRELVELLALRAGEAILDIGGGVGGPRPMDRGQLRLHGDRRSTRRGGFAAPQGFSTPRPA